MDRGRKKEAEEQIMRQRKKTRGCERDAKSPERRREGEERLNKVPIVKVKTMCASKTRGAR